VLPFEASFAELVAFQRYVYFAALISAAIATLLLISPSVNHRLRWRRGDKEALLRYATRMSIAATVFVAFAMTSAVYLITDVVLGDHAAALVTSALAALFAWFWYGLPLWIRLRNGR
jgi:VIT1/CCC1 family predicted Fe2+/Mn2+ transporter